MGTNAGNQGGNDGNAGNEGGNPENRGGNAGNLGGNEEDQGENLRIRVEMMNKKCGEMELKGNVRIYKNIVLTLWYEKQLKKVI